MPRSSFSLLVFQVGLGIFINNCINSLLCSCQTSITHLLKLSPHLHQLQQRLCSLHILIHLHHYQPHLTHSKQNKLTSSAAGPTPVTGVPIPLALPLLSVRSSTGPTIRRPSLSKRGGSGSSAALDLRRIRCGFSVLLARRSACAAAGSCGRAVSREAYSEGGEAGVWRREGCGDAGRGICYSAFLTWDERERRCCTNGRDLRHFEVSASRR